jgi:serine protease Do
VIVQEGDDDGELAIARLAPLLMQEPPLPPAAPLPPGTGFGWVAGTARGSYLGVGVADVDSERARALKLNEERGVEITRVNENTPAEKAGLKANDVVLEYNGERIEGMEQFQRMVRETPPGRQVKLLISRNGQTQTITATVGDRKEETRAWEGRWKRDMERLQEQLHGREFEFHMPEIPRAFTVWSTSRLGVEAETLSPQLAEFFGVKKGVLVRSVNKDSAAEKAGIKAGDVITKVGGEEVSTPSAIASKLRTGEGTTTVPVTVVRNRSEVALNVTVEAPNRKPAAGVREVGPRRIKAQPAQPAPPAPFRAKSVSL